MLCGPCCWHLKDVERPHQLLGKKKCIKDTQGHSSKKAQRMGSTKYTANTVMNQVLCDRLNLLFLLCICAAKVVQWRDNKDVFVTAMMEEICRCMFVIPCFHIKLTSVLYRHAYPQHERMRTRCPQRITLLVGGWRVESGHCAAL